MASADLARYSFDLDDDTSYQPLSSPQHSPVRPRGQGYQVAQSTSYLPPPDPYRSSSPSVLPEFGELVTPPARAQRSIPTVPSLDSYYQYQDQRNSWTGSPVAEPERPRRLSAYRRDRTDGSPAAPPPPPPPPPHKDSLSDPEVPNPIARNGSPERRLDSGRISPIRTQNTRLGYPSSAHGRPLSQLETPTYRPDMSDGSPTRSERSLISERSGLQGTYHIPSYYSSSATLAGAAAAPGLGHSGRINRGTSPSPYQLQYDHAPYSTYAPSSRAESRLELGTIDPMELADDDDDDYAPRGPSYKMTALGSGAKAGVGGGMFRALGGQNNGKGGQVNVRPESGIEKSAWLTEQSTSKKRMKWIVFGIVVALLVIAVASSIGHFLSSRKSTS